MNSIQWSFYNTFQKQIEMFNARTDLTDQDVIVRNWMSKQIKSYEEMQNDNAPDERNDDNIE